MARNKNDDIYLWLLEQQRQKNRARTPEKTSQESAKPSSTSAKEPWVIARTRIKLSDGSTIRIETVLNSVQRLRTHTKDGRPMYSVKAETKVEVIEAPENLMMLSPGFESSFPIST